MIACPNSQGENVSWLHYFEMFWLLIRRYSGVCRERGKVDLAKHARQSAAAVSDGDGKK